MWVLIVNGIFLAIGIAGLIILWRTNGRGDKLVLIRPDRSTGEGRKIFRSYILGWPLIVLAGIGAYISTSSIEHSVVPAILLLIVITIYALVVILSSRK